MKAVVFHEHGGLENLKYEDVPTPEPGEGEVLIDVKACGVNHVDKWIRLDGKKKPPMPHIMGTEVAGEVAALGSGVRGIAVGQAVAVSPWWTCGVCEWCLKGEESLCLSGRIVGMEVQGGFAEYMVAPATHALPIPQGVSCIDAAAVLVSTVTAWHMMVERAAVKAGEDVLVLGADGGVGSSAVQIAKLHGARVIATTHGLENARRAKELGADQVVDIEEADFQEEAMSFTNGRGVDLVVEHVGAATWERSVNSLARNGRVVVCGDTTGRQVTDDIHVIFRRQLSIIGSMGGTRKDITEVLKLVQRGLINPAIYRTFALQDAPEAERIIESRLHFGKMVVVQEVKSVKCKVPMGGDMYPRPGCGGYLSAETLPASRDCAISRDE